MEPKTSVASAPGKIFWIGGYAVLDRPNVAFVTGVDKRVFAKVTTREDNVVLLNAPQFKVQAAGVLKNGRLVFEPALAEDVAKKTAFVRAAVDTALRWLANHGAKITGFELTTIADPAFGAGTSQKSGLGSSAAVTAATTGALFAAFGRNPTARENRESIHKLSQYAHFRAQGKVGSGFDIAAACFGAIKYVRYSPSLLKDIPETVDDAALMRVLDGAWDYQISPLPIPTGWVMAFGNFIGTSTATVSMAKLLTDWKTANPVEYKTRMSALNAENGKAIDALEEIVKQGDTPERRVAFKTAFDSSRVLTRDLLVLAKAPYELPVHTALIDASSANGAFVCRLPGGGGDDGIAALCLSEGDKLRVEKFWASYGAKPTQPVQLGVSNEGVRMEPASAFDSVKRAASV